MGNLALGTRLFPTPPPPPRGHYVGENRNVEAALVEMSVVGGQRWREWQRFFTSLDGIKCWWVCGRLIILSPR